MSIFFIITIFIATIYTIDILGKYEADTKISLICAIVDVAYIAACVYLTSRGL